MSQLIRSAVVVLFAACQTPSGFDPPSVPAHNVYEEGAAHARGMEIPFVCHDPVDGRAVTCPDDIRPEPISLSCDAAAPGCDCVGGCDFGQCSCQHQSCWTQPTLTGDWCGLRSQG